MKNPLKSSLSLSWFCFMLALPGAHLTAAAVAGREARHPVWEKQADLGFSRLFPGVAAIAGKIYVFGGHTRIGKSYQFVREVEEYDPQTNTVKRMPDMLHPRALFGSVVVGHEIYVIGGNDDLTPGGLSARVEAFDPVSGKWTGKASLKVARAGLRAAVVGDKIFAFGGFADKATVREVYDLKQDTWTRLEDMKQPILNPAVTVHDQKIFVLGGGIPDGTKAEQFVEIFDPATATWTLAAQMPVPKGDHTIGIYNNKLYVIAGWNDVILKSVEVLDLATMTWSTRPDLDHLRFYHGEAVIDGKFYIVAGAKGDTTLASEYTNTVCLYDPSQEQKPAPPASQ